MIYIFVGNDTKKKNSRLKSVAHPNSPTFISLSDISEDVLTAYASSASLFGDSQIFVMENFITQSEITPSTKLLTELKDSPAVFILLEDKLLSSSDKKYAKYATIERFDEKSSPASLKFNTFSIADAFSRGDKIDTWILYREAITKGVDPEPISGILFWKIKNMIQNGTKTFSSESLKRQSSELVSLYHLSHRGEADFVVGLEQFILSSLSK